MIDVRLSEPQALALLAVAREGTPPTALDGRTLGALRRGLDRIDAALSWRARAPPAHAVTLDDLSDALTRIQRAELVDLIHLRAHDMLAVTRLWLAAEALPHEPRYCRLLSPDMIDTPGWRADVLDALDAAGDRAVIPFGADSG